MNKTVFNLKIITIVQFILCLIFAFAIWISVKYADVYSASETDVSAEQTSDTTNESNFNEV